jgi:CDP-diacylglycerol--serine O-phosphatidyltransferase
LILREKILYYVLPIFFTAYLIYGFVRPSLSRAWRKEIEEEDDDESDNE